MDGKDGNRGDMTGTGADRRPQAPMYDTRVPDAIDNALFLALGLGLLVAAAVTVALLAMLDALWDFALLLATVVALGVGMRVLGQGNVPWRRRIGPA